MDGTRRKPAVIGQRALGPRTEASERVASSAAINEALIPEQKWTGRTTCAPPRIVHADPIASREYDGYLVGTGGRLSEPTLSGGPGLPVDGVKPRNQAANGSTLFINGVMNTLGDQMAAMQGIADVTGTEVIGIHNATDGGFKDVLEALGQRLNVHTPQVVKTTAAVVLNELSWKGESPIRLVCHSQGGLVLSQALDEVSEALTRQGLSKHEVQRRLSRIEVISLGSVAASWPDGPRYTHIVNEHDPLVKSATALGFKEGLGARLLRFKDKALGTGDSTFGPHLLSTYLGVYSSLVGRPRSS